MRRALPVIAVATALVVVGVPPAWATDVVSTVGLPGGVEIAESACNTGGFGDYRHVTGPGTPLHGSGSLRLDAEPSSSADLHGPEPLTTAGALGAVTLDAYRPAGSATVITVEIWTSTAEAINFARTSFAPNADGTWASYDVTGTRTFDFFTIAGGPETLIGSGTWADFVAPVEDPNGQGHGGENVDAVFVVADNCNTFSTGHLYVDHISFGGADTYDFEPSPASSLTSTASKSKITVGQAVTLGTLLRRAGVAYNGEGGSAGVTLQAKPAGASAFTDTADIVAVDVTGHASSTQHPSVTTAYRWVYGGDHNTAASISPTVTVQVARALTIHVLDKTLTSSQKLVAYGTEKPAKAGSTVTLWRRNGSGATKLGRATVQSDGSLAKYVDMPKGSWSVYVTSPAETRYAAGKSASISVSSA
jgi:hypothetical protein